MSYFLVYASGLLSVGLFYLVKNTWVKVTTLIYTDSAKHPVDNLVLVTLTTFFGNRKMFAVNLDNSDEIYIYPYEGKNGKFKRVKKISKINFIVDSVQKNYTDKQLSANELVHLLETGHPYKEEGNGKLE